MISLNTLVGATAKSLKTHPVCVRVATGSVTMAFTIYGIPYNLALQLKRVITQLLIEMKPHLAYWHVITEV